MASASSGIDDTDEWLKTLLEADVLISVDDDDSLYVEKYLLPSFRKLQIRYVYKNEHFTPGNVEISSLHQAVQMCKKTMIILSRKSIRDFPLELYLAIHKSLLTNKLQLTAVLIKDLTQADIPKMPWLEFADTVILDENIPERCIQQIERCIKCERSLSESIPVCNVGRGMAWSHFIGYLKFILPDLQNSLTDCDIYTRDSHGNMPIKFYMLLPRTARNPGEGGLEALDDRLRFIGNLKIVVTVAGTSRTFTPSIYSIREDSQVFYCCVEIPNAFCSLGSIFQDTLGKLTPQQRHVEVERFYYQMMEILNIKSNEDCKGRATMLLYNDEAKTEEGRPGTHLLRAIKKDLNIPQSESTVKEQWKPMPCDRLYSLDESEDLEKAERMKRRKEEITDDVCILFYEEKNNGGDRKNDHDKYTARSIQDFLRSRKISRCKMVSTNEGFHKTEVAIRCARWTVLLLSEKSMSHMHLWIAELLSAGNMDDMQRLLPVLIDVEPDSIPDFVRWVTYVSWEESGYIEKIGHIVAGESASFKSQTPVGNVSEGFVWAFVVNYLRHILPFVAEKGEKKFKELKPDVGRARFVPVLFEFIPWKTCDCPSTLQKACSDIIDMGRVELVRKDVGTVKERVFSCNMFLLKTAAVDYYFMGEFVTPIRTLHQMHTSMRAGLSNEQMQKQAVRFGERLKKILHEVTEKWKGNKCEVILYDDTNKMEPLEKLLTERIDDIREGLQEDVRKVCDAFPL